MEGTLDEWTVAALAMIRRTLETLAVPVVGGHGNSRRCRVRRSLASALASKDCSPTNGRRLSRISTTGTTASGDESNGVTHSRQPRGQSMLRRLLSASMSRGQEQGGAAPQVHAGAEEQEGHGQHRCQHEQPVEPGGGTTSVTHGGSRGEQGRDGAKGLAGGVADGGSINGSPGVVASSSSPSPSPSLWPEVMQQRLQQQQQQQREEPGVAQASFDELLRDAQAETGSGMGIGIGIGMGTGRGRDVMRELLVTSEELVKAVEMQQKVRETVILVILLCDTAW